MNTYAMMKQKTSKNSKQIEEMDLRFRRRCLDSSISAGGSASGELTEGTLNSGRSKAWKSMSNGATAGVSAGGASGTSGGGASGASAGGTSLMSSRDCPKRYPPGVGPHLHRLRRLETRVPTPLSRCKRLRRRFGRMGRN